MSEIKAGNGKGMFMPEVTVEMFRNAPLEAVEELMADGEVFDVDLKEELHREKERAYYKGYEDGRKSVPEQLTDAEQRIFLAAMAKEEPEQRWIPCSEGLPEDLEEVNVTWVNHDPEPYYDFVKDKPFTATAVYYKEKWYWYSSTCADILAEYGRNPNEEIDDGIEIIAWMPLPEPFKEV